MIIEAFARYLQAADPSVPAPSVLVRWLWERLSTPAQNNVDKVIRYEISVDLRRKDGKVADAAEAEARYGEGENTEPYFAFRAETESGRRLLKSLYEYAMSYEQQKWARFVHCVKASDFRPGSSDEAREL